MAAEIGAIERLLDPRVDWKAKPKAGLASIEELATILFLTPSWIKKLKEGHQIEPSEELGKLLRLTEALKAKKEAVELEASAVRKQSVQVAVAGAGKARL